MSEIPQSVSAFHTGHEELTEVRVMHNKAPSAHPVDATNLYHLDRNLGSAQDTPFSGRSRGISFASSTSPAAESHGPFDSDEDEGLFNDSNTFAGFSHVVEK